jgi:hypothetical protein
MKFLSFYSLNRHKYILYFFYIMLPVTLFPRAFPTTTGRSIHFLALLFQIKTRDEKIVAAQKPSKYDILPPVSPGLDCERQERAFSRKHGIGKDNLARLVQLHGGVADELQLHGPSPGN